MRLRLLIEVEAPEETRARLAELLNYQPVTHLRILTEEETDSGLDQMLTGRFVGATQVHGSQ